MPIKVLDPQVIARIAAGEVVERPASVVKELVENSLDAGSSQISIETRGGGIGLIRVSDNGLGIPAAELELAFQRHATSKIARLDDLDSISSLGFRGEALPSIAAVAQVEIISCSQDETVASHLSLREGSITNRGSQARSQGTTVTVGNLFRSVPARLKFLKSVATENSHIANVISQYALAYPEVKFSLLIDGRATLRTPGSGRLIDCVIEVYGLKVTQNLLELDLGEWQTPTPLVTGMIGSPQISYSSRDYLSFFVNRRWINSRLLAWAVEQAYQGLLMSGKHPIAIINLSLPPGEVDVNIHPSKSEVKFQNERLVFNAVQKAVRQTLIKLAPVPRIEEVAITYGAPPKTTQPWWKEEGNKLSILSRLAQPTPAFSLPALRLLGQLTTSYIVAEGPDGLYLLDQHAAHERILFEKIKQQQSKQGIETQGLLEPATLEITPKQEATLKAHDESLADFGFLLEPFGERTYLVRTVPALLHKKDWAGALRELLDSPATGDRSHWRERMATSIACHGAVRAGQVLTDEEMRQLLRQLEQVALPNTCPHGRPTMIHLSSGQMEREFGRS